MDGNQSNSIKKNSDTNSVLIAISVKLFNRSKKDQLSVARWETLKCASAERQDLKCASSLDRSADDNNTLTGNESLRFVCRRLDIVKIIFKKSTSVENR